MTSFVLFLLFIVPLQNFLPRWIVNMSRWMLSKNDAKIWEYHNTWLLSSSHNIDLSLSLSKSLSLPLGVFHEVLL